MADATATLMRYPALRIAKGEQAKAVALEKFDWDREAASLLAAYGAFRRSEDKGVTGGPSPAVP